MDHAKNPLPTKPLYQDEDMPPLPVVDASDPDGASVVYSTHRTMLSTHRTALSEHRTQLSEHRTDLSTDRTEMSSRRTGMSFQRTRMSADRTLMSVIRTSLSMIGFGFTIYQAFKSLAKSHVIDVAPDAAGMFGQALIYLGVAMIALGIVYHLQFMVGLRRLRHEMTEEGLIHGKSVFPPSLTLIIAVLLLLIGVAAIAGIAFRLGPFG